MKGKSNHPEPKEATEEVNILFSGAIFHPQWQGGEPAIGRELVRFLSKKHNCNVCNTLPFKFDQTRSIIRFIDGDNFSLSSQINKSNISKADIAISFYDFDLTIINQCMKRKIPVIATQHIYWGLCPKFDLWNNTFNCSCTKVDPAIVNCKKCISAQKNIGPRISASLFSDKSINNLRINRRKNMSQCDTILVPSKGMANIYKKELGDITIEVIPNGLDTKHYSPVENKCTSKKKRILYAGARTYTKGYHHFAKLATEITKVREDVEFVAFGYGKSHSVDCVKDLGYLSNSEITKAYSDSYLLVFPSLWDEPFGLIPLESMACGCPVIAYSSCGVSETVVNGHNGYLVPTGDYNQLLKTTLGLIDDESKNKRMKITAREHVVKNYSMEQMLDRYEETLSKFTSE